MIFLYLFLSHLTADFVFQPDGMVSWKRRDWKGIAIHTLIYFITGLVFLFPYIGNPTIVLILLVNALVHFAIDREKIKHEKSGRQYVKLFFLDQMTHVLILALVAWIINPLVLGVSLPVSLTGWYGNSLFIMYFIMAILLTFCIEIVKYQFSRQTNPHVAMNLDFGKMFIRLLIFSVAYSVVLVLALTEVAKTVMN